MSEAYLEGRQLNFQVFHNFRRVTSDLRFIIFRRTKRLEFLDNDLGFVHLGLFNQSFKLLQTGCYRRKVKLGPLRNATDKVCVRVFPEEFVRGRAEPKIESDSAGAHERNPQAESSP